MRKEYTRPIKPLTSTKLKPINDQRTKLLRILGLRDKERIKLAKTRPTPNATPAKQIIGMLEAKYLNPNKII
jgi:hypothetical protein